MPKIDEYYGSYSGSVTYALKITIDHTKVSADLTDYVLYVDMADTSEATNFWGALISGGGNIQALKSDKTTELPRELVDIDTSAKTGGVWVKYTGTLSSTVDTVIYLKASTMSADYAYTDTYGRNNVWSAYAGVWHMNQDPAGTAPQLIDSTGANDMTNVGGLFSTDLINSKIGKGIDFKGGWNKHFNLSTSVGGGTDIHVSAWIKSNLATTDQRYITDWGTNTRWLFWNGGGGKLNWFPKNGSNLSFTVSTGVWYKVDGIYKVGIGTEFYLNGGTKLTGIDGGGLPTVTDGFSIGAQHNNAYFVTAEIDEVRIGIRKTNFWIATEYANQNSPSTFYSNTEVTL